MKIFATCVMVWIAAVFAQINGTNLDEVSINENPDSSVPASLNGKTWKMKPGAAWAGYENGQKNWYKLFKNADGLLMLFTSNDSLNYNLSKSGTWYDKDGRAIRIGKDRRLVCSTDSRTWLPLAEGIWQDANTEFFMLDKDASLWKMEKDPEVNEEDAQQPERVVRGQ